MVQRVDALLEELTARHGTGRAFMDQLRPVLERIFDPGTPAESCPYLLELVAETCERQVELVQNREAMRAALADYCDAIAKLIARLAEHLAENRRR